MLEWKLISMLDKNPEILCSFDYDKPSEHRLFEEFRDIYFSEFFWINVNWENSIPKSSS